MLKVLLTGSEGFVGQTFIKEVNDKYFIYALTLNENPPSHDSLENLRYVEGNILNRGLLKGIFAEFKPDVILHLAAIATTKATDIEEVFEINFDGTLNIYLALLEVQQKMKYNPKILFVSSAEVYGKTINPENIEEDSPLYPTSIYASSKIAGDRLSYQLSQSSDFRTAILRPFPHTGPGQRTGFFVPDVASQIAEAEMKNGSGEIAVGNVDVTRDYLDVRDVVEAYKYFIEHDFIPGEAFNICSGKALKLTDALKLLKGLTKKELKFKTDPTKFRISSNPIFVGNNNKLKDFSGWSPKIEIEKTLEDTLDYWRQIWKDKQ